MSLGEFLNWLRNKSGRRIPARPIRQRSHLQVEQLEARETPSATAFHADFGPSFSAVEPGYVRVVNEVFSTTKGYGWQSTTGLATYDRGGIDALTRDGIRGTDNTLLVNLANGNYRVTALLGDAGVARDQMQISAEGQVVADGIATAAGEFKSVAFDVSVTDGQLSLRFRDLGGATSR